MFGQGNENKIEFCYIEWVDFILVRVYTKCNFIGERTKDKIRNKVFPDDVTMDNLWPLKVEFTI